MLKQPGSVNAVLGERTVCLGNALLLASDIELLGNAVGQFEQAAVRAAANHKAADDVGYGAIDVHFKLLVCVTYAALTRPKRNRLTRLTGFLEQIVKEGVGLQNRGTRRKNRQAPVQNYDLTTSSGRCEQRG